MPPLDFPNSPAVNDTWVGGNGATYTWDGTKWVVSGSSAGAYLLLAGGTMTGPIALAADPVTDPQAANKHYVDASINLAGNYLGTWAVASNTPNISAGGSISNANYVATTVNPATPETVPAGVPGIAGLTVGNGDRIIWASGLGVWQILRNAGVTLAAADARYYAISNPSGYISGNQTITLSGDVSGSGTTAITGTLATVNANVGSFTNASITVDAKGRITAASSGSAGGSGTVTGITAGTGLTGGTINTSGTIALTTPVSLANGGTGASSAGAALTSLGAAPLASPAFTGTPTAITQSAGNNTTALATTAFVTTAVANGAPNASVADNSGFAVNQRAYVSGTALATGAYGHDRWKGGASGCTYTFTQSGGPATTVTITAGSLQQVVEGAALITGSYTLSWTGTAQGRTGAGSYAASPVAVSATAGSNLTIEFNTGTLAQVKLEPGTVRTTWIANSTQAEIARCQRFANTIKVHLRSNATGAGQIFSQTLSFPTMRAIPTATATAGGSNANISAGSASAYTASAAIVSITSAAAGDAFVTDLTYLLSADL